ncbi:MAG: hypothetical protein ACRCXK_02065 [Wohlfahrtiimonas sp.]
MENAKVYVLTNDSEIVFHSHLPKDKTEMLLSIYMKGFFSNVAFNEFNFNIDKRLILAIKIDGKEVYRKHE